MIKKNRLRKIYAIYTVIVGELFAAALIICSMTILKGTISDIITILGFAAVIVIPAAIYFFYRLRGKDNEASSDELEQLVLQKAFTLAGIVAVTLLPALLLLCFVFPEAAGITALVYSAFVAASMKLGAFYYNRKY